MSIVFKVGTAHGVTYTMLYPSRFCARVEGSDTARYFEQFTRAGRRRTTVETVSHAGIERFQPVKSLVVTPNQ